MASSTTIEAFKSEETLTNNDSPVGLTEGRKEGTLPSRKRKLHSLTPSETQDWSENLSALRQSALTRYDGSFKLRFLGDGSTRKGRRKGTQGTSSNTTGEDIENYQKQTESSSLRFTELNSPEDQAVVNEVALGAGENEGGDGREDDNAMVALGAGGDGGEGGGDGREGGGDGEEGGGDGGEGGGDGGEGGGDGGEGGGDGGGDDRGDLNSEGHPLTPSELPGEKEEEFRFFLPEEEPVLHRDFQQRAKRAVQSAVLEAVGEQKQSASQQCFQCCNACCEYDPFKTPKPSKFTPQLKVASTQGLKVMKKLFSPVLPRVLRDLWVYAEIAVTLYSFILALISLSLENNQAFNITYLVLSTISVALALLDGFIYFIQLGSCVQCFRYCYSKYRRGKVTKVEKEEEEDVEEEEEERGKKRRWWKLSPRRQQQIGDWLELARNIATELLIYPLLICDLFDFIVGGSLRSETDADRINFSLFVVGGFYLVVSVYFMRMFMVIGSIINLVRIPINASNSRKSYLRLIVWFAVHVLAQVFASAVIIVTVAVKINDENSVERCPNINDTMPICASPFLVYDAVVGGIIPLFGVASFFVVNFYRMKQMSAGLWIDMVSLLQSESFADLVFQGEGVKAAKSKAKNFVKDIEFHDLKKQYKAWQNSSFWDSIVYPLKIPIIAALGILYELLLASFLTTIFLGQDIDDLDIAVLVWYSVVVAVLVIVNFPIILFATTWLLMALAMLLLAILLPVYVLLQLLLLYIPVGTFFGCLLYCKSMSSEFGVFKKPVRSLNLLRKTISGNRQKPKQKVKNIEKEDSAPNYDTVAATSESVPLQMDPEPIKLTESLDAGIGDITIEFVDTHKS